MRKLNSMLSIVIKDNFKDQHYSDIFLLMYIACILYNKYCWTVSYINEEVFFAGYFNYLPL